MAAATSTEAVPEPLPEALGYVPIGHPSKAVSVESVRRAVEEFSVLPTDVIVVTFPKTGTTLACWLCHLIRSKCDVSFKSIYEAVPWPLLSWDIGVDPNESKWHPRVYKSHLRLASVYRGCRYVVTVREPGKTALSFYNFLLAKKAPPVLAADGLTGFITDTYFIKGDSERASLWEMYLEYTTCLDCSSVLFLVYEDMVKDMQGTIRMLARFMGVAVTDELVQEVEKMSTKEFMLSLGDKLDEPYVQAKAMGRMADPSMMALAAKVVLEPHKQTLDATGQAFLDQQWQASMAPAGYKDYEAFADAIRAKNKARFP